MIAALLALPLLAGPAAVPSPVPGPAPAPQRGGAAAAGGGQDAQVPPPIQEEGEFYVLNFAESTDPSQGIDLAEFLKLCQDATGRNFIITAETKQQQIGRAHV